MKPLLALLGVLLAASAQAQTVTESQLGRLVVADDASSIHGQVLIVTPVYACDGTIRDLPTWVAPRDLTVSGMQIWPGADAIGAVGILAFAWLLVDVPPQGEAMHHQPSEGGGQKCQVKR